MTRRLADTEWRDPDVWGPLEEALRRAPNKPRLRLVNPGLRPILQEQNRICSCGCGRPVRSGNIYAGRGCNSAKRALTPAIIRQRLAEGASITEIAEEFGAARWTVYRRIRQMRKEQDA